MQFRYCPQDVCSTEILFELDEDHTLRNLYFAGGCSGNLAGIAKLTRGMKAEDIIERLRGTPCGSNPTSCPDQLAKALTQALQQL